MQTALAAEAVVIAGFPVIAYGALPTLFARLADKELSWYMESWCWCPLARTVLPRTVVDSIAEEVLVSIPGRTTRAHASTSTILATTSIALALLCASMVVSRARSLTASQYIADVLSQGVVIGLAVLVAEAGYLWWSIGNACHVDAASYTKAFVQGAM